MSRLAILALCSSIVFVPALALAAGDAHGDGHTTTGQWITLVLTGVNFTLFALLIRRFTRVPIRDFLSGRRKQLVEDMAHAARLKQEAEALKEEYERKIAGLEQSRRELVEDIRALATADRERLLAAAREAGERLKKDVERTASSDLERARRELREEAARLAAELASAEIRQSMGDAERGRLLREFLDKVASA